MQRPRAIVRASGLLLAAAFVATGARALEAWDQETVTAHASRLTEAVAELRQAFRQEPVGAAVLPKQRTYNDWLETLKGLEQSSRQLASRLEEGADREATLPVAKKIRRQVRDARRLATSLPPSAGTRARIDPVVAELDALVPYYFEPATRPGEDR